MSFEWPGSGGAGYIGASIAAELVANDARVKILDDFCTDRPGAGGIAALVELDLPNADDAALFARRGG